MTSLTNETFELYDLLREIEDITDINGCFFINIEDNKIIESTITFRMPEEILWEISVLVDTFNQFTSGIKHGALKELMLEGDKGYIILYTLPPHLILMMMGPYDLNLAYLKLAMIDILDRMRRTVIELGDEILKLPSKDLELIVAADKKIIPTLITAKPESPISVPEKISIPSTTSITRPIPETPLPIPESPLPIPLTPEPTISKLIDGELPLEEISLREMIKSLSTVKQKEKMQLLGNIFERLKNEVPKLTGMQFSETLEFLKDGILENIGTSLALFDISKATREVGKNIDLFKPEIISKLLNRIDNWKIRIVTN